MKRTVRLLLSMLAIFAWSTLTVKGQQKADTLCVFSTDSMMHHAECVAAYFMRTTPDVGADSYVGGKKRNSRIWTRGVFYEGLLNIYKALGVEAKGKVAIKMSTGEGSNPNYLKPELIKLLVEAVDGTIVECNTA